MLLRKVDHSRVRENEKVNLITKDLIERGEEAKGFYLLINFCKLFVENC